jgi:uncharacterized surface protein with fasciclin (FAS1) repeats
LKDALRVFLLVSQYRTLIKNQGNIMADIVETATNAGSFKTLLKAVEAAGLLEILKSPGMSYLVMSGLITSLS